MLIPIALVTVLGLNQGFISYLNTSTVVGVVDLHKCIKKKKVSQLAITQADQGKTFTVHSGSVIALNLAENPSTGYIWEIEKTDPDVIEFQNSTFYSSPTDGRTGVGGKRIFTFKAKATGVVRLKLKEWQSWQGDRSTDQRFHVTLQIK
ncbi:protease inhibitor I42 family protein [Nostocales cyanobacterium LEGE 12452]|nr:protease inhibitor I42 family protein [Nostocales cyanobacterium LEGE 12452]